MIKNLVIFICIICIIVLSRSVYLNDRKLLIIKDYLNREGASCAMEMFDLVRLSEGNTIKLYQLMKDVDMVLRHHKITYWAEGGTLLGALRHKGIIPYDDDLDIQVDIKDLERLKLAIKDLEQLGYRIGGQEDWYQILAYDPCSKDENHMDIFLMEVGKTNTKYVNDFAENAWGNGAPSKQAEIYPVKEADFGNVKILIPNDPMPYLERYLGKDVMKRGCIDGPHSNHIVKRRRCFDLQEKMLQPATPLGPLEDRRHILGY